ncbi:MAG: response regulator [Candidatus Micrarchaeia archaeon]
MKKILIVDDEVDIAETMKMLIELEGYAVEYTTDALKGLGIVKDFDLLILDIMMPKMSGRQFLVEMKKRRVKTPVIVASSVGLPGEVQAELMAKYKDIVVISKPAMHTDLVPEIKRKIG